MQATTRALALLLIAASAFAQRDVPRDTDFDVVTADRVAVDREIERTKAESDPLEAMQARHGALPSTVAAYGVEDTPGVLRLYSEPVRFLKAGEYRPIQRAFVRGLGDIVYESAQNAVYCGIEKTGAAIYRDADARWGLRVEPWRLVIDGDEIVEERRARFVHERGDTISLAGALDIDERWRVGYGSIKHSWVLPESFRSQIEGAKSVAFAQRISDTDGARWSVFTDGEIVDLLATESGAPLTRLGRIAVIDAAGESMYARYEYTRDGDLITHLDVDWILDAARVWPIEVDPTVNMNASSDIQNCGESGATADHKRVYLKFNLPGLDTCTSVDLYAYLRDNFAVSATFTLSITTTASNTWDGSTACATLNGYTWYTTGVSQAINSGTSTGWITWANVHGVDTDANAIDYLYDGAGGACDPPAVTVQVSAATGGTTDKGDSFFYSANSAADEINFDGPGDANPPYLAITYSGSLGCAGTTGRRGSGSVGLIGG